MRPTKLEGELVPGWVGCGGALHTDFAAENFHLLGRDVFGPFGVMCSSGGGNLAWRGGWRGRHECLLLLILLLVSLLLLLVLQLLCLGSGVQLHDTLLHRGMEDGTHVPYENAAISCHSD